MGRRLRLRNTETKSPIRLDDVVIELVGGSQPFVWIGNGPKSQNGEWCIGTMDLDRLLVLLTRDGYALDTDGLTLLKRGKPIDMDA